MEIEQMKETTWEDNLEESDDEDYTPEAENPETMREDDYYFEKEAIKEEDLGNLKRLISQDEHLIEPYDINLEHYSQMREQFIPKSQ